MVVPDHGAAAPVGVQSPLMESESVFNSSGTRWANSAEQRAGTAISAPMAVSTGLADSIVCCGMQRSENWFLWGSPFGRPIIRTDMQRAPTAAKARRNGAGPLPWCDTFLDPIARGRPLRLFGLTRDPDKTL
jgi:hypothetical protein